jgi:hypothetical protein
MKERRTKDFRFTSARGEIEIPCRAEGYQDADQRLDLNGKNRSQPPSRTRRGT